MKIETGELEGAALDWAVAQVDPQCEGQSLSARLAEIAERYALVCEEPPELTDQERHLLGNTLSGSVVEPLLIKYLEHEIQDSDAGGQAELNALAARISAMSYAERVALVESLGF